MLRSCSRAMLMQAMPLRTMSSRSWSIICADWTCCFVGAISEQAFRSRRSWREGLGCDLTNLGDGSSSNDGVDGPLAASRCQLVFLENRQERELSMSEITTIGLDLAKHVFQVHGIDAQGTTVLRKRLRRGQVPAAAFHAVWSGWKRVRRPITGGASWVRLGTRCG